MKITVSKFNSSKTRCDLFEEPEWDSDEKTTLAWAETKERYSVDFDGAKFCLDLFEPDGTIKDTFYMAEKDYSKLTNLKNKKGKVMNKPLPLFELSDQDILDYQIKYKDDSMVMRLLEHHKKLQHAYDKLDEEHDNIQVCSECGHDSAYD